MDIGVVDSLINPKQEETDVSKVEKLFNKYFSPGYLFDGNIVNGDNKTVSFEDYGIHKDEKQRLDKFKEDLKKMGYKLNVVGEDFTDKEYDDLFSLMEESPDPEYMDYYLKKYPEMRDKEGYIDLTHSNKDLAKEYIKSRPEYWQRYRDWLDDDSLEDREREYKEQLSKLEDKVDTNDNGKIEKSEMDSFTDSLNDYMTKNKKGRDDIPVTTRR